MAVVAPSRCRIILGMAAALAPRIVVGSLWQWLQCQKRRPTSGQHAGWLLINEFKFENGGETRVMSFARQQTKRPSSVGVHHPLCLELPGAFGKLAAFGRLGAQLRSKSCRQGAPRISVPTKARFHVGAGAGKPGVFLVRVYTWRRELPGRRAAQRGLGMAFGHGRISEVPSSSRWPIKPGTLRIRSVGVTEWRGPTSEPRRL